MKNLSARTYRSSLPTGGKKTVFIALVIACFGFTTNAKAAADECVIQVSENVIDYGRTTRAQLMAGGVRGTKALVGTRTLTLTAVCEEKTGMELSFKGQAVDDKSFRFGQGGAFTLKIVGAQLDGRPVQMTSTGAAGSGPIESMLRPNTAMTPRNGQQAATGERLTLQVEVETRIDVAETKVRSEVQWEGSGHFQVDTSL